MKHLKIKKRLNRFLATSFTGAVMVATMLPALTGCVADVEANGKSVADYKDSDVKSYGDLFEVFWSVMNQRYCVLHEQPGTSSLDWDQVYAEYKPKFEALKSFRATSDNTQEEIQADNAKAKEYFKEIVGNIIDQHFQLKVTLPLSHASQETVTFKSTLRQRGHSFPLDSRWLYNKSLLLTDSTTFGDVTLDGFCVQGGFLASHPDTYYLGFNSFKLSTSCNHSYKQDYLPTNTANAYHLDSQQISAKATELVASSDIQARTVEEATTILANIDRYLGSDAVAAACRKMAAYSANGGDYHGMNDSVGRALSLAPALVSALPVKSDVASLATALITQIYNQKEYKALISQFSFTKWFAQAMAEYLLHEREFYAFWSDLKFTYQHPCVENYRRRFLEPLAKGEINKLILDLRSNTGGIVSDTRLLSDYLVSHTATFAYMRKKEDNTPYGYSPWVPQQIVVTSSSLGRDIPTAVLIDNWSASMSEMTSLILKSQGDHVSTIGRNSYGAQCMLISDNSSSNGGWQGNVTSYLWFYMPVVMTKDAAGNILEAVGITPDYAVDEMTAEEISKLQQADPDARDKDIEKALDVLSEE